MWIPRTLSRRRRAALLVLPLVVCAAAEAQETDRPGDPARSSTSRSTRVLNVTVSGTYRENAFNLRRRWSDASAAERRIGYSSPWDLVTAADVELRQTWRRPSRARVVVAAGGTYEHYVVHAMHSAVTARGSIAYRSPGRTTTSLGAEWTPRTLMGNRHVPDGDGME
jgi:hypothetical protein